uniref:KIB1-4 beta-propeller domain-containing protein n=1 Tax=Fagus sylvatica TaxID=28930 RepID=A0A2N9J328_FAGSY
MADWSGLHYDLLVLIVRRIAWYEDFNTFRGVCKSWKSAAIKRNFTGYWTARIPCLMLAAKEGSDLRDFFSICTGMTRTLMLPEAANQTKCYSSQGWLITVAKDMSINLLHPFTRLQKKLPNATTLFREQGLYVNVTSASYDAFIDKFVLTASPSHTSDYVVLVMYYGKLAFCRPGDESWTRIIYPSGVVDAVYHNNRFYCLGMNGIFVCDIEGPNPNPNPSLANHVSTFSEEQNPRGKYHCGVGHVVESSGTFVASCTTRVYEVGLDGGEWKELKSLGDRALFLGYNSSISVEVSDFSGCKANCIYFTECDCDSYSGIPGGGGKDMGIYNMLDGSIQPHYPGESRCEITPPLWVVPSS